MDVYEQNNSIEALTIYFLCTWVPSIIFGPFFGVLADRYNRKNLLVIANSSRGISIIVFSLFYLFGINANIFALSSILGIAIAFYMPAASPMLQEIIQPNQLINANTMNNIVYEFCFILGMGLSGLLLVIFSIQITMLIGGVLFVVSTLFNILIKYKKVAKDSSSIMVSKILKEYFFLIKYLKSNPNLIPIYVAQILLFIVLMTSPILLLPFIKEILNVGAKEFSMFEIMLSVGIIFGGTFSPVLSRRFGLKIAILGLVSILAINLFLFAVGTKLNMAFFIYFLVRLGFASWALIISYGQMLTENSIQGRLQASCYSISGIGILGFYIMMNIYSDVILINKMYLVEGGLALLSVFFIFMIKVKK